MSGLKILLATAPLLIVANSVIADPLIRGVKVRATHNRRQPLKPLVMAITRLTSSGPTAGNIQSWKFLAA